MLLSKRSFNLLSLVFLSQEFDSRLLKFSLESQGKCDHVREFQSAVEDYQSNDHLQGGSEWKCET